MSSCEKCLFRSFGDCASLENKPRSEVCSFLSSSRSFPQRFPHLLLTDRRLGGRATIPAGGRARLGLEPSCRQRLSPLCSEKTRVIPIQFPQKQHNLQIQPHPPTKRAFNPLFPGSSPPMLPSPAVSVSVSEPDRGPRSLACPCSCGLWVPCWASDVATRSCH